MRKYQKGLIFIPILIIAILVVAGYFVYQNYQLKKQTPQTRPTPSIVTTTPTPTIDPTADWETYTNNKYNYSLKYPEDWLLESISSTTLDTSSNVMITSPNGSFNPFIRLNIISTSFSPEEYFNQQKEKFHGRLHKQSKNLGNFDFMKGFETYSILVNSESDVGFDNIFYIDRGEYILEITKASIGGREGISPNEIILNKIFSTVDLSPVTTD